MVLGATSAITAASAADAAAALSLGVTGDPLLQAHFVCIRIVFLISKR